MVLILGLLRWPRSKCAEPLLEPLGSWWAVNGPGAA